MLACHGKTESEDDNSSSEERQGMLSGRAKANTKHSACHRAVVYVVVASNIFLFLFSLALISLADWREARLGPPAYSPLLDRVTLPRSTVQLLTSFRAVTGSPFIGPPGPAVDAAWERAGSLDPVALTRDEVLRLGKNVSTAARWPASFGRGPEAYIGAPNARHHIHCLDQIRRDLDFAHYYGDRSPGGRPSRLHRYHTDHCLYILLKQLMCRPSTEMFVFDWVDGNDAPFPDFDVRQTCVDFDALARWHEAAAIPRRDMLNLRAPPGQARKPMSQDIMDVRDFVGGGSG